MSQAIGEVLDRADFVLGADVQRFEREFAEYCGVPYAIGLDSGLSALELALRAAGVGPDDEVITQANTFIATVGAIMAVGARPVLVDCDQQGVIDPDRVERASTAKTRAIIPVHLFGRICDMQPILELGQAKGIDVIEDACQAHGAVMDGRRAGSFGISAAFSFYPAKNLGAAGDGGMLVTHSAEVDATVRQLRNYGQRVKYEHVALPLNHRLDTIQAAVLRVKLRHLDEWNERRRDIAEAYREHLTGLPVTLPHADGGGRHVYHLFVIQSDERDGLRAYLSERGIETGIHYPIPAHLQPVLAGLGYKAAAFPNAERLAARSLSLPMYPELPLSQVEEVATAIRSYFER